MLLLVPLALGAWWYWFSGPFVGHWTRVSGPGDELEIRRAGTTFRLLRVGTADVRLRQEGDRLVPDQVGTTIVLIYDPQTDQLRYPVFSDVINTYRRVP